MKQIGLWYHFCKGFAEYPATTKISNSMNSAGIPNWPEDIAAAWELTGEIAGDYLTVSIDIMKNYAAVHVHFEDPNPESENPSVYVCSGQSDTAPLAICKAWLAWKRGENETHQ